MNRPHAALFCSALVCSIAISAAAAPPATLVAQDTSCQKEVRDYLNTLRFVRQSTGAAIGGRVEQAYINEKELNQLVAGRGYCAAAQALRAKGAVR